MNARVRQKQKGVALITAVLMVALATILAVQIGFKAYLNQRRAMTVFALDQGYEGALAAEAFAAEALMSTVKEPTTIFSQLWARPIRNMAITENVDISGELEDMSGRFNLNQLGEPANPNDPAQKKRQQDYIEQFRRILEMAQLEPQWADKIVDWIDADTNPFGAYGAEDDVYTTQNPPYHTANRHITRVSEILALPEFGLERYQKLEPLVSALPTDAVINLCTAPGIVLDSFSATQRQYSRGDADWLLKQRAGACFPDKHTFSMALSPDEQQRINDAAAETSSYFRATIVVTIGSNRFTLYSLLKRDAAGVRPITRSFGTT